MLRERAYDPRLSPEEERLEDEAIQKLQRTTTLDCDLKELEAVAREAVPNISTPVLAGNYKDGENLISKFQLGVIVGFIEEDEAIAVASRVGLVNEVIEEEFKERGITIDDGIRELKRLHAEGIRI